MNAAKYPLADWPLHLAHAKNHEWVRAQSWLTALQEQAATNFLMQGWPARQQESWRYTDLSAITNEKFSVQHDSEFNKTELKQYYLTSTAQRLVFINGKFAAELSEQTNLPAGVIIGNLATVLAERPEWLQIHLQNSATHILDNLNLALLNDGVVIYLPKNTVLKDPVELVFFTNQQPASLQNLRLLYLFEDHAKATIIENYCGNATTHHFINNVAQINLGKAADLTYLQWQNSSQAVTQLATTQIQQQAASRMDIYQFALGGKLSRHEIAIKLQGANAECSLHGLGIIAAKQQGDLQINIDHQVSNAKSHVFTKNIVAGLGKGIFAGKIVVQPHAQKTKAQLTNRNLLLAANAEINTKPDLEIYADDVQCAHGATVGQFDQQALFYLRARGVPYAQAMEMLVQAFVSEILAMVPDPILRAKCQQLVEYKLKTAMISCVAG